MLIHVIWVVSDPSSNLGLQRAVAGRYERGGGWGGAVFSVRQGCLTLFGLMQSRE